MLSSYAGHALRFLIFTHMDSACSPLIPLLLHLPSYSTRADCVFLSSWAPLISSCSISIGMAVMASATKIRKFQTTFFGEQNNKAALFKNIYLVEDLMRFIITGKHSQEKNKCLPCKLGQTEPILSLCILGQRRTQGSVGSAVWPRGLRRTAVDLAVQTA